MTDGIFSVGETTPTSLIRVIFLKGKLMKSTDFADRIELLYVNWPAGESRRVLRELSAASMQLTYTGKRGDCLAFNCSLI